MSTLSSLTFDLTTQAGRVAHLRAVLVRVAAEQRAFNINLWTGTYDDQENRYLSEEEVMSFDCGTSACALGWYVRDPDAQAAGWSFRRSTPRRSGFSDGLQAAVDYFGLRIANLFLPSYYTSDPTVLDVIEKLDEIVAKTPSLRVCGDAS